MDYTTHWVGSVRMAEQSLLALRDRAKMAERGMNGVNVIWWGWGASVLQVLAVVGCSNRKSCRLLGGGDIVTSDREAVVMLNELTNLFVRWHSLLLLPLNSAP